MDIWTKISKRVAEKENLSEDYNTTLPRVNCHIHTPWSYSSFDSIDSIIERAKQEDISVLGINDFNTVAGYSEWAGKCLESNIYPVFNIEMIGLDQDGMSVGRRVNDPGNPGRIYISGKGLAYPTRMSDSSNSTLIKIRELSNEQVQLMTHKTNKILSDIDSRLYIDFNTLLSTMTQGMARERHLAGMIRVSIDRHIDNPSVRGNIYTALLGERYLSIDGDNYADVENLIRSKLLKAGGAAFVEESPELFLDPEAIRDLILDCGGIPTYPFLADFDNGRYTDFEENLDIAADKLNEQNFFSVEFIPGRNDHKRLKEYVLKLYSKGFIVTFGTEHNSPGISPLEVTASGGHRLDDDLLRINYEGVSIIAAHQFNMWKYGEGYLSGNGRPKVDIKKDYIALGDRLIKSVCNK